MEWRGGGARGWGGRVSKMKGSVGDEEEMTEEIETERCG